ncbi:hypothetical protein [Pseudoalteromonas apostichopi]|uniref:hypothetical protein n=1 Tax=Pseudoalteromonas apostichopi TaxID=3035452 RepID=UPI00257486C9|nr:hypothetical protein [Pseudoalteromonas sp. FE4]
MAKYKVSYAYYEIKKDGKAGGKTGCVKTVEATSDMMALKIIEGKHPGKLIELRSIEEIKR